jgi:hypothetical protein
MLDFGDAFEPDERSEPATITAEMVVFVWESLITGEFPWYEMPLDDRRGYVGSLVGELLDISDGVESDERRQRLETVARRHGAFRRAQKCSEAVVSSDFSTLREALREALLIAGATPPVVRQATRWLIPDWRFARRAARTGFAEARRGSRG